MTKKFYYILAGSLIVILISMFYYTDLVAQQNKYAQIPFFIFLVVVSVTILRVIDELFFPSIDTEKLLHENPLAYVIYLHSYAIIIAAAILAILIL